MPENVVRAVIADPRLARAEEGDAGTPRLSGVELGDPPLLTRAPSRTGPTPATAPQYRSIYRRRARTRRQSSLNSVAFWQTGLQTVGADSACMHIRPTHRRSLLRLTAWSTAALAGLTIAGRTSAIARANHNPLVGSWRVAGTPAGAQPAPPRILVSFSDDGVAIRTAPLQQAAPPALGTDKMFISTTHGAWTRDGDGTFGLTFVGMAFDAAGQFLATQRIRVAVEVSESGDAFSGPFKTDFLGADGQVLASSSGMVQATRIDVEPLA
jgi:hypothetical protein